VTHDEIDNLKAGKRLDAIVAEAMGWTRWCSPCVPKGSNIPDCWQTGNKRNPTWTIKGWCPSTEIRCTWEVLHYGHPSGWFDAYYFYRYGDGYALSKIHNPSNEQGTVAPTAPLAICRTFLKVMVK